MLDFREDCGAFANEGMIDFSEMDNKSSRDKTIIEKDLFDEYVKKYKTEKGILLKRRLYGIIAKK